MKGLQPKNRNGAETLFVFSLCISLINGGFLQLDQGCLLHYVFCRGVITFDMIVMGAKGWIGLGFNNRSDMDGSDLLIGGYKSGRTYWADYHVPRNAGNSLPILDKYQDWINIWGYEGSGYASLYAQRNLCSADKDEDMDIKNEQLYLIWAYNKDYDDVTHIHSHRGSVQVNLLDEEEKCRQTTPANTKIPYF